MAGREVARMLAEDADAATSRTCWRTAANIFQINPRDALALVRRGLTLLLLGRGDEAAPDLEAIAPRYPDNGAILEQAIAHVRAQAASPRTRPGSHEGCASRKVGALRQQGAKKGHAREVFF